MLLYLDATNGFVICGRRHHNCYSSFQNLAVALGISDSTIAKNLITRTDRDNQGFVTSTNRYVNRAEAFKIAKLNNQIYHSLHENETEGILISEDLY